MQLKRQTTLAYSPQIQLSTVAQLKSKLNLPVLDTKRVFGSQLMLVDKQSFVKGIFMNEYKHT